MLATDCFPVVFSDAFERLPNLLSPTKEQTNAMRPRLKTLTLCALAAALAVQSAPAAAQRRTQSMNNSNASRALQTLLEDDWEWTMRENPTFASTLGDRRYNERL